MGVDEVETSSCRHRQSCASVWSCWSWQDNVSETSGKLPRDLELSLTSAIEEGPWSFGNSQNGIEEVLVILPRLHPMTSYAVLEVIKL